MVREMIHVLTLTWNGLDKLNKLKPGLLENLKETDYIWHIKDNGSKDETVKIANTWENTKIYETGHNRDSFAKGVNYLFEQSNVGKDDYILLLNNDVTFKNKTSIKNMLKLFNQDIGVVGSKLLYTGTDLLQHAGVIFGERYNKLPYHFRHKEKADSQAEKNRYFQAVTAACMLIKANLFNKINGMCEDFKWAFDDVDLCLRAGQAGQKIVYCGNVEIYHDESHSLKKNGLNKLYMNNNVKKFREKWSGKYDIDHNKYLNNPNYGAI